MNNRIPRDFIRLLLDRTEIIDLIDSRISLRKKSGSNHFYCCPFHQEKTPSFSVSQSKQFYHCFGCGVHGNAIDFLMQYDHLNFKESLELLAKQAGLEIPNSLTQKKEKENSEENLYPLLEKITQAYQTQLRENTPAIDYLKKRGISGETAKTFKIGFAPNRWDYLLNTFGNTPLLKKYLYDAGMLIKKENGDYYDRFRERIMFPIQDRRGRIIGFGGRILERGEPKYLNSPETVLFQKGRQLYGVYSILQHHRQLQRVLVVEGYMDVISLFQHGITYAVATLGTATTPHHLEKLFRSTSEIIFCFDGDEAGRTAAWRALQVTLPILRDGFQIRFMFLPDGEDPDTLIRKEGKNDFEKKMQATTSLSDFFFQTIASQTDVSSLDGRARLVKLAREHLNPLPDTVFKKMMLDELAKKARLDIHKVENNLSSYSSRSRRQKSKPLSPLRLVITLLIQQPELANFITEPLPHLQIEGFDLLLHLIEMAKKEKLTTGMLLEYWRDREEEKIIAKLAQIEHMIPEAGIKNEFLGAIQRLRKMAGEKDIEMLLAKAAENNLDQDEKNHLRELIKKQKEKI